MCTHQWCSQVMHLSRPGRHVWLVLSTHPWALMAQSGCQVSCLEGCRQLQGVRHDTT
jgi:hypothetical protein